MKIERAREILQTIAPAQTLEEDAKLYHVYIALKTAEKALNALGVIEHKVKELREELENKCDIWGVCAITQVSMMIDENLQDVEKGEI